ncbi:MAG: helix-turn-helix transcriptional regulator [Candidatus Aminicenantes bacterium]|nr:helix-turn-helix transcriptional regulator [Candidatus Aminicenantes bacterium]
MKLRSKNFINEVGNRLELARKSYGYGRSEMAQRLGIARSNLYRSEIGFSLPRMETLLRLHELFDISLDWLLFGIGPMHLKEKQAELADEKQTKALINETPDVKELLTAIEQDPILRHELLTHFYKYKQDRQTKGTTPLT